jgi:HEAT repeat protein
MALALEEVRRRVNVDEPDYPKLAATLGAEAVPELRKLVEDHDAGVASKAAYVLSFLPSPESLDGLEAAARSEDENVRVAAAAAFGNLASLAALGDGPARAEEQLRRLLTDSDPGVRKVALRSAQTVGPHGLRTAIENMASSDPEGLLRRAAEDLLSNLS